MKNKPKKNPVGRPKKKLEYKDSDLEKLATM